MNQFYFKEQSFTNGKTLKNRQLWVLPKVRVNNEQYTVAIEIDNNDVKVILEDQHHHKIEKKMNKNEVMHFFHNIKENLPKLVKKLREKHSKKLSSKKSHSKKSSSKKSPSKKLSSTKSSSKKSSSKKSPSKKLSSTKSSSKKSPSKKLSSKKSSSKKSPSKKSSSKKSSSKKSSSKKTSSQKSFFERFF